MSRCSVTALGQVNCSSVVYNDFKIWKKSRDQIEMKIKNLKAELEALKEIRKHLKEKRPAFLLSTTDNTPLYDPLVTDNGIKINDTDEGFIIVDPTTEFNDFTTEKIGKEEMTEDYFIEGFKKCLKNLSCCV